MAPVLTHPAWCSLEHCTADARALTVNGMRAMGMGSTAHRSAPIPLDLPLATDNAQVEVRLTRAVAPWRCVTYLRVLIGPNAEYSIPVDSARAAGNAVAELLRTADDDPGESP